MKFDPGKAWPHPVLHPSRCGDDYPRAEFEVEIEVKLLQDSMVVELDVDFELSDPDLLKLVIDGAANYSLLVRASKTHFRDLVKSADPHFTMRFTKGELSGRVEFAPFLVATRDLPNFLAAGWHSDFSGRRFDIAAGAVLAEDVPKTYWIETADESPLGSIIGVRPNAELSIGQWEFELAEDRVWILMSEHDLERFSNARAQANFRPEGQYLINGLYLPALIAVLNEVDQNADEYRDFRWFASLDHRLEAVNCNPLGHKTSKRHIDAQTVLDSPFVKMPIIADVESKGL